MFQKQDTSAFFIIYLKDLHVFETISGPISYVNAIFILRYCILEHNNCKIHMCQRILEIAQCEWSKSSLNSENV